MRVIRGPEGKTCHGTMLILGSVSGEFLCRNGGFCAGGVKCAKPEGDIPSLDRNFHSRRGVNLRNTQEETYESRANDRVSDG